MENHDSHCPKCSKLKLYVDQQAELMTQLMKMIAANNRRLNQLEWDFKHLASKSFRSDMILNPTLPYAKHLNE